MYQKKRIKQYIYYSSGVQLNETMKLFSVTALCKRVGCKRHDKFLFEDGNILVGKSHFHTKFLKTIALRREITHLYMCSTFTTNM